MDSSGGFDKLIDEQKTFVMTGVAVVEQIE
jgi:hypothetical protein